jgi:uracil-DNA glycosylase
VHDSSVRFGDASGERLRHWMGITPEVFCDPKVVAILPMGFCYPGTGTAGDLQPRPECAPQWRARLHAAVPNVALTLVIGRYAQQWHLPDTGASSLTDVVKAWRGHWPAVLPLPHPSPRKNIWLKANPWFVTGVVPELRVRACEIAKGQGLP